MKWVLIVRTWPPVLIPGERVVHGASSNVVEEDHACASSYWRGSLSNRTSEVGDENTPCDKEMEGFVSDGKEDENPR